MVPEGSREVYVMLPEVTASLCLMVGLAVGVENKESILITQRGCFKIATVFPFCHMVRD